MENPGRKRPSDEERTEQAQAWALCEARFCAGVFHNPGTYSSACTASAMRARPFCMFVIDVA